MIDNRSLESKLLALSKGKKVKFTAEEQSQIGHLTELSNDEKRPERSTEKRPDQRAK